MLYVTVLVIVLYFVLLIKPHEIGKGDRQREKGREREGRSEKKSKHLEMSSLFLMAI